VPTVIIREYQAGTRSLLARRVTLAGRTVVEREGVAMHLDDHVVYQLPSEPEALTLSSELAHGPLTYESPHHLAFEAVVAVPRNASLIDGSLDAAFEALWHASARELVSTTTPAFTDLALVTRLQAGVAAGCRTARAWHEAITADERCVLAPNGLAVVPLCGRDYFTQGAPRSNVAEVVAFDVAPGTPREVIELMLALLGPEHAASLDHQRRALAAARRLA
jgi:hypothetical protein